MQHRVYNSFYTVDFCSFWCLLQFQIFQNNKRTFRCMYIKTIKGSLGSIWDRTLFSCDGPVRFGFSWKKYLFISSSFMKKLEIMYIIKFLDTAFNLVKKHTATFIRAKKIGLLPTLSIRFKRTWPIFGQKTYSLSIPGLSFL